MNKEAKEQLDILFKNLGVYYIDELKSLLKNVNYVRKEIVQLGNIVERSDIYHITILIEKIKKVSTCFFNKNLISICKKIHEDLNVLQNTSDLNELSLLMKHIDEILLKLEFEIKDFFHRKIDLLKTGVDIEDFLLNIMSSFNIHDKFNNNIFFQNSCIKYLSNDIEESLSIKYKNYFSNIRFFVKNNTSIYSQLPLNNNPIVDLIRLGYCIHTELAQIKYVCDSDSIILAASAEVLEKKGIFDFIEQVSYDNSDLQMEKEQQIRLLANDELREVFDYGSFSISQYFFDFNILDLFGLSKNHKNPELNFLGCAKQLKLLPELFLSNTDILNKINNKRNLFEDFIKKIKHCDKPTIPLDILSKLTNLYFHCNITSATYINLEIYKGNSYIINKLSEFEDIYSQICCFIKKHDNVSRDSLKRYLEYVQSFLSELDTFYKSCLEKEDQIFQEISNGNFFSLEKILQVYKVKNYKEILGAKSNTKDGEGINAQFSELEKAILNEKLEYAQECSENIVFSVFENSYYNTPKLLSFRELPPIAHNVAVVLEKNKNSSSLAISNILKLNDNYWST